MTEAGKQWLSEVINTCIIDAREGFVPFGFWTSEQKLEVGIHAFCDEVQKRALDKKPQYITMDTARSVAFMEVMYELLGKK